MLCFSTILIFKTGHDYFELLNSSHTFPPQGLETCRGKAECIISLVLWSSNSTFLSSISPSEICPGAVFFFRE